MTRRSIPVRMHVKYLLSVNLPNYKLILYHTRAITAAITVNRSGCNVSRHLAVGRRRK